MRWPVKVRLLLPGKIRFSFVKEGASFYVKRLNHYYPFVLEEKKIPKIKDPLAQKEKEGEILLKAVSEGAFLVALDEKGKTFDSQTFAQLWGRLLDGEKEIDFVIGGPFGLGTNVLNQARLKLSLSKFTLGHEIALLVLLEQLYRATSILCGEPYHK